MRPAEALEQRQELLLNGTSTTDEALGSAAASGSLADGIQLIYGVIKLAQ